MTLVVCCICMYNALKFLKQRHPNGDTLIPEASPSLDTPKMRAQQVCQGQEEGAVSLRFRQGQVRIRESNAPLVSCLPLPTLPLLFINHIRRLLLFSEFHSILKCQTLGNAHALSSALQDARMGESKAPGGISYLS